MNCGFCCTRHPIEQMGEHGWGKCGQTEDRVVYGAQWLLEHWARTMEDHAGWQDILEDTTEALFPYGYGELIAKDNFTPEDEETMLRSEANAERRLKTEFVARFCFLEGIDTQSITRAMEANE
jgi:hypothetical protein